MNGDGMVDTSTTESPPLSSITVPFFCTLTYNNSRQKQLPTITVNTHGTFFGSYLDRRVKSVAAA